MRTIEDLAQLRSLLGARGEGLVGFFGDFSDKARRQLPVYLAFAQRHPEVPTFLVDVGRVKDVHRHYGVTKVPTVLRVRGDAALGMVVGERPDAEYDALLAGPESAPSRGAGAAPAHRVTVYSTTTCPWCVRLKDYLRRRGVSFTDVDVSRDQAAARRMMAKSGQMGVPQAEIDGHMVVGFDRDRIDALLGLARERMAS
ncbi:MAG TPA: glutaredoxin domain-containing protein [Myxococcota bacterium]|jgi:glutaredoxin-like YruB-family protein|nr:glutaredoxin domain-containing protein [Myxococcota bacterium]